MKKRMGVLSIAIGLVVLMLATLLTGCHEAGDKPSTSAGTTETDGITASINIGDESATPTGQYRDVSFSCFSFDEFAQLYNDLDNQNNIPLIMINWDDAEYDFEQYSFYGGVIDYDQYQHQTDYPFPDRVFTFAFYDGVEYGPSNYPLTYEIAIHGECYVLEEALSSLEGVTIREIELAYPPQYGDLNQLIGIKGTYEVYQGNTLLLQFTVGGSQQIDETLCNELGQQILQRLVCMG